MPRIGDGGRSSWAVCGGAAWIRHAHMAEALRSCRRPRAGVSQ